VLFRIILKIILIIIRCGDAGKLPASLPYTCSCRVMLERHIPHIIVHALNLEKHPPVHLASLVLNKMGICFYSAPPPLIN
jgi:hypothetical protein